MTKDQSSSQKVVDPVMMEKMQEQIESLTVQLQEAMRKLKDYTSKESVAKKEADKQNSTVEMTTVQEINEYMKDLPRGPHPCQVPYPTCFTSPRLSNPLKSFQTSPYQSILDQHSHQPARSKKSSSPYSQITQPVKVKHVSRDIRPFPNLSISKDGLLRMLVEGDMLNKLPAVSPPHQLPAWYKPEQKCTFHSEGRGHCLNTCIAFRRAVWRLLDEGRIQLDSCMPPNVWIVSRPGHSDGPQAI